MRVATGFLCAALAVSAASASPRREPVIDMHLHASRLNLAKGEPICPGDQPMVFPAVDGRTVKNASEAIACARPLYSPTTAEALMRQSLAALKAYNIRRAVTSGPEAQLSAWRAAAPDIIIPALDFSIPGGPDAARLRQMHAQNSFAVFAELTTQYRGEDPADPRLEPFWALAEELDIPVGIHLGEGMPAADQFGDLTYRAALTSPFQLEPVLARHPHLRVYVMHYGSPLVDEMIAMLFAHGNLYVDVAANDWNMPRAHFYGQLKRLVDAGFSKRIMFGSDQTIWPQGIGKAVETIEQAPFLTREQKRDILYDNASRFLRLTPEEVRRDHQR